MAKLKSTRLEQFKNEVASEVNIRLGAEQSSRNNGKVGGEMVRRLIERAEHDMQ